MLTRLGPIFGDASGSTGGITILRLSGGHSVRVRKSKRIVTSSATTGIKSNFQFLVRFWKQLAPDYINSWNLAAATLAPPNRLGQNSKRSGFALFMSRNMVMAPYLVIGFSQYPGTGFLPQVLPIALTITSAIGSFTFFCTDAPPADAYIRIFGTPPLSHGISSPAKYYRFFTYLPFSTAQPFQMADIYKAYFKTVGNTGDVIWIKYDFVDGSSGVVSPQAQASITLP